MCSGHESAFVILIRMLKGFGDLNFYDAPTSAIAYLYPDLVIPVFMM
jgi:hypothetical protein